MSKVAIQGNASGTGTLTVAAPNTNTDYTLTLPAETGTVLTSASLITQNAGPAFAAYLNSSQQFFSANTWTKVTLNAEQYDTNNCFDSSTNYRFTPTVEGYYIISGGAYHDYSSATAGSTQVAIYKNGSMYAFSRDLQATASYNYGNHPISRTVYLNGSTDYVELYVYSNNATPYLNGGNIFSTWMDGALVRAA